MISTDADLRSGRPAEGVRGALRGIAVNGKFLSARPTGVHRVATELLNAVGALLAEEEEDPRWELLKPRDAVHRLSPPSIPERTVGLSVWQPWEQFELPLYARDRLLLSLCNLGPLAHPAQVVMMHDAQVFSTPESYSTKFRAWYKTVQPLLGRRAARILTVSEFSAQQLDGFGVADRSKITVVHNGCDHFTRVATDLSITERHSLTRGRYVVALANTQRHKNIAVLFKSWADPRLSGLPLVLVGAASASDFIHRGHTPPPEARFVGAVTDPEFKGLLDSALCLAFPSLTEGFGLPPLEAMSTGCPVIAAPNGALPEVCGDAAIYADAAIAEAWAEAIVKLTADEGMRRGLSQRGYERAADFTWARSARQLIDLMEQL